MPRIAFLIGNGFDLNIGLATRYDQFCKHYLKEHSEDFLAKSMKTDMKLWSDLELALGKVTEQVQAGYENCFGESKDLLELSLADYLENEQGKVIITEDQYTEIATAMAKSFTSFYQDLPIEHKQQIEEILRGNKGDLLYSVISFNYTDILDKCVEITRKMTGNNLGTYNSINGYHYSKILSSVMHIHGTLDDEMILGVNDVGQIANKKFAENSLYKQCLVKEEANKRFAQNKIQRVKDIIDQSGIICVFGMSIGETDKLWWQYIGKWLQTSKDHRLIIFIKHKSSGKRITTSERFLIEDNILEKFRERAGIKDEWEKIKSKIYIDRNGNMFNLPIALTSNE